MKAIYMMISGVALSIIAALAMAGLISLSTLIKPNTNSSHSTVMETNEQFRGMWVTKDGYIRHELLPGGRYDEARGNKNSAYQGSYTINGNHIDYKDDTGFIADGDFKDGVLYHGGYIFYRED
jgi:uncharacterized lipoprotein YddW (UPF0748 family)